MCESLRGSELSIENGIRTALPATPKVGTSRLKSSTSGRRVRLPTGTAKIGHAPHPQPGGRLDRRRAFVPVAVGGQHDAAQVRRSFPEPGRAARSGRCRGPAAGSANAWMHDVHPLRELVPRRRVGQSGDRLAAAWSAGPTAGRRARRRAYPCWSSVPEHGDRRLFLGAELLDPFGLIEQRPRPVRPAPAASSSSNPIDGR